MPDDGRDLRLDRAGARPVDAGPWAVALNESAGTGEVRVTLLSFAVVDDVVRISGVVRLVRRSDVKLLNVPTLTLAPLDGAPLGLLAAHVLPSSRMVWASWTFERPAEVCTAYEGRIDRIDLAYRAGGVVREAVPGPWLFSFRVPADSELLARGGVPESIGGA